MIKVEVTEGFTLKDFNKLKNVERKSIDRKGELFVGDTFECDEEMVKYLSGGNKYQKPYVKVIEVLPTKKEPKIIETIETPVGTFGYGPVEIKETKPKKKKASKK